MRQDIAQRHSGKVQLAGAQKGFCRQPTAEFIAEDMDDPDDLDSGDDEIDDNTNGTVIVPSSEGALAPHMSLLGMFRARDGTRRTLLGGRGQSNGAIHSAVQLIEVDVQES